MPEGWGPPINTPTDSTAGWGPPKTPGATHYTSGSAGELPTPPSPYGPAAAPQLSPETSNPAVGEYPRPGDNTAVDKFFYGAGKIPAGLVGGAAQLAQGITPFANQYSRRNPLSVYATSSNPSWWSTLGEFGAGAPLAATRVPAAAIGGVMATPSGSVASHLGGAALGKAVELPFQGTSAFANWMRQRAAQRAATVTKDQAPQAAMRRWMENSLDGTGIDLPPGEISGDVMATTREDVGGEYRRLNSGMDWQVTPDTIAQLKNQANQVAGQIRDTTQRRAWLRDFNDHVLRPLTVGKTDVPRSISGKQFANYVQRLRNYGHNSFKHSPLDPNGADKQTMGRAFRDFADRAEDLAEGPDKALRDRMRQSYAQLSTLDRAAPFEGGSVATPRSILHEVQKGLGTDAAARLRATRDPILQEMERLRRIHESPETPTAGGHRLIDIASRHGPGGAASFVATAAAARALGIPIESWVFPAAWGAMHYGIGDQTWQNLANYAARLSGRGVQGAGRAAAAVPPAGLGLLGGSAGQSIGNAMQNAQQSPTGGVAP